MLTTVTSTALLEGLRDPDNHTVWDDYLCRYRPLVVRYARRIGLGEADAEDIAQQTLLVFATAYRDGKYEREKGRLRGWLFGIARTTVHSWHRKLGQRWLQPVDPTDGTRFLERIADDDRLEELWEEEWRSAVLRQCFDEVRQQVQPQTFRAFELFALESWPAQRVADHLDITENAVFGAKRRVLRRLREVQPLVEEAW